MELLGSLDLSFVNNDPFLLFFGAFYTIIGLSIFLTPKDWLNFVDLFVKNRSMSLILGIFTLPMSLFIVVFYESTGGIGGTILMVMGYIGLVKSLVLFLCPNYIQKFMDREFAKKYIWLDGFAGVALGGGMLVL